MAVIRALIGAIAAFGAVTALLFFGLRLLPGDAMTTQLRESGAPLEVISARRAALGLDAPIGVQFAAYISGLARGEMGVSLIDGRPVRDSLAGAIPSTLALAGSALAVGLIGGVALGVTAASTGRLVSGAAHMVIALGLSAPTAIIGTIAILIFALSLGWFPGSGPHVVLPALTLGWHGAAAIGQVTAAGLIEARDQPFMLAARGRGLPPARLTWHGLRWSLPFIMPAVALEAGFLFSGTAITEAVFARAGVGRLLVDAALRQDYPVVQGAALWCAAVVIMAALIGQGAAALADPRLRAS